MSDININVTVAEEQPINVTLDDEQPINITLDSVIIYKPDTIYWNDIIDRPTYDEDYGTYVFP